MASWSGIPELRESYRTLGPLRFWTIMGVLMAWLGGGVWLQVAVGWPEAYGFHCRGKGCLFTDIWHSPVLLHHGGLLEWLLFAHFMTLPGIFLVALVIVVRRKFRQRRPRIVNDLLSKNGRTP